MKNLDHRHRWRWQPLRYAGPDAPAIMQEQCLCGATREVRKVESMRNGFTESKVIAATGKTVA